MSTTPRTTLRWKSAFAALFVFTQVTIEARADVTIIGGGAVEVRAGGTQLNVSKINFSTGIATSVSGDVVTVTSGATTVTGPGSSTDRAIATWNGTGGTVLRDNSGVTISAGGNISVPALATVDSRDVSVDGATLDTHVAAASPHSGHTVRVTSTTDNAITRFDGTSGAQQNSAVTIDDSGNIALGVGATVDGRDISVLGTTVDGLGTHAIADIGDSGTTQTQRARLNFIDGNSWTMTCADNSGTSSYDCTGAVTTSPTGQTAVGVTRSISTSGSALSGGGDLSSNRTITLSASPDSASVVGTGRTLTAGAGLTGTGDLSADRTFAVGAGAGITVSADSIAVTHVDYSFSATVNTTNAASTDVTGCSITVPDETVVVATVMFIGVIDGTAEQGRYGRSFTLQANGGTLTTANNTANPAVDYESTGFTTANGPGAPTISSLTATFNVGGIAATTIHWRCVGTAVQIAGT